MCGIWACVGLGRCDVSNMYSRFMKMQARGPDKSTFIVEGDVAMGFHRLAIRDTSHKGDQPFVLRVGDRVIRWICNGEIYEYGALVDKYNLSFKLQSTSDCEIIGHIYLAVGIEGLCREIMGGEFACVIIDSNKDCNTVHCIRDPLGVRPMFVGYDSHGIIVSSELKGMHGLIDPQLITQMAHGSIFTYSSENASLRKYYDDSWPINFNDAPQDEVLSGVRDTFIAAVESMMYSDRPLGALLSGGLDSSLVVSVASRYLARFGQRLHTFSIGMPGSTDGKYAAIVAKHCNTIHTHIECSVDDFIGAVAEVVRVIESPDITTVRASTGQYLVSKIISEKYGIKVLLIGDGSDELLGGYLYFHKAPNHEDFHNENCKLLREIKFYDVLRADRGVAGNGMEARVPFLKHTFVDYIMKLNPVWRVPRFGKEKWLLRSAFSVGNYLPTEILYRKKEAFSDGVSSVENSWYSIVQSHAEAIISDEDFVASKGSYGHLVPPTKEALYYLRIYLSHYPDTLHLIPHYWLPNWVGNITEPSARVLGI